jgi:hypothetical protein
MGSWEWRGKSFQREAWGRAESDWCRLLISSHPGTKTSTAPSPSSSSMRITSSVKGRQELKEH